MEYTTPTFGQSAGAAQPPSMGGKPDKQSRKDDSAGKKVTKRVIDKQMKLALLFTVIGSLVVGAVLYGSAAPKSFVVVAKAPISAGTAIDPAGQLEAIATPEEFILPGSFKGNSAKAALEIAKAEVEGKRAQYPLAAKQQVGKDQFNVEIALAEPLKNEERLVSVEASVSKAVAGSVVPGDTVDVFASAEGASSGKVTGLVLSNVPVVSVTVSENQFQAVSEQQTGDAKDKKPQTLLPSTPVPGIYVLRVTAADAAKLVATDFGADLSLVYRPKGATALTPGGPLTAAGVICEADPTAKGC